MGLADFFNKLELVSKTNNPQQQATITEYFDNILFFIYSRLLNIMKMFRTLRYRKRAILISSSLLICQFVEHFAAVSAMVYSFSMLSSHSTVYFYPWITRESYGEETRVRISIASTKNIFPRSLQYNNSVQRSQLSLVLSLVLT